MPNIAAILNEQIRRLSRRATKSEIQSTRKITAQHRRDIARLKRQVAELQRSISFLQQQEKRRANQPAATQSIDKPMRFRADGLRSLRRRLGLSAEDYGRLIGVSGQSVYLWETGRARPRKQQVVKIAALRGLGKREIQKRLELADGKGRR